MHLWSRGENKIAIKIEYYVQLFMIFTFQNLTSSSNKNKLLNIH